MFRAICRSSPIAKTHLTQSGIAPQVLTERLPILELIAFDQIEGGRSFGSSWGSGCFAIGTNEL